VAAFKKLSGSSVKQFQERILEKQKTNSSVRLCIALTDRDQTRMKELFIIDVYTNTGGLGMHGTSCNANQKQYIPRLFSYPEFPLLLVQSPHFGWMGCG